ncbi:hypothetical protein FJR11_08280 [Anabaena sp. UHCC 0187]|uniref:hypothetical protein n=1 Tax=Anabaena sp. UHCC 0187 TaxID=2590018 RepID=UPI0014478D99|nr:hypothetical protein [Anabaena sp. UHCC 0187]MTJ12591.1 hypothetical protein [Anabaena sp. UHCC 0187]
MVKISSDFAQMQKYTIRIKNSEVKGIKSMDVKLILVGLTVIFTVSCLFFGTKNGFYDSDDYHGNGSAH